MVGFWPAAHHAVYASRALRPRAQRGLGLKFGTTFQGSSYRPVDRMIAMRSSTCAGTLPDQALSCSAIRL